ncbi:MAG: ATP-binding protein [Halanaerobiales bacterium]
MNIKRLFIRDFGIFNNQLIDDIKSGIVIVGGLNRAGKTTLLQILRHLPFGFPKRDDFPPARDKHEVEALINMDNNDIVNIHLKGYAVPKVSSINLNKNYDSASDLYNGLDLFTYHQLFTISLDELQLNKNNSNKDIEKLQSIFLGAGLKEFIMLPQMEDSFAKEADKIGGTKGDPKVKEFKPYYNKINDALIIRENASSQLDAYHEKKEELSKIKKDIEFHNKKIEVEENKLSCLDILKSNFDHYKKIVQLESKLNTPEAEEYLNEEVNYYPERANNILEKYQNKINEINKKKSILKQKTGIESIEKLKNNYRKYKDDIKLIQENSSGIKEKIRFCEQKDKELNDIKNDIELSLNKANEDWQGDLDKIKQVKTDEINFVTLQELVEKYKKIDYKLEQANEKLLELEERKNYLYDSLETLKLREPKKRMKLYFLISLAFIVTGLPLVFINTYLGLFSLAGILGLSIYYFYVYALDKGYITYKESTASEVADIDHKIKSLKKRITSYNSKIFPIEKSLDKYKLQFGLTHNASVELLKEFFRVLQDAKSKMLRFEQEKDFLNKEQKNTESKLEDIYRVLSHFKEIIPIEKIDEDIELIIQDDILFPLFEQLKEYLKDLSELITMEEELLEIKNEGMELFNNSKFDYNSENNFNNTLEEYIELSRNKYQIFEVKREFEQVKEQFKAIFGTEMTKKLFESYFNNLKEENEEYQDLLHEKKLYERIKFLYEKDITYDKINSKYDSLKDNLVELKKELKNLNDRRQQLNNKLAELASDVKLKEASSTIDEGRQELRLLAEKYAVNKTAEYILKKVRETFIQKTKNELLTGASQYFKKITNGEYKAVLPVDNIMNGDFQALMSDGSVQNSTVNLSRGTAEQLFLAVRINRIREVKPSLPVIIDDSFVNFDNFHLSETVEIFNELARSHQVFILTCHPHFIDLFDNSSNIQYWQLDKGQFAQTSKNDLINYLRRR